MSGNQGTPSRQSAAIPGRLSAIPPSSNPRSQFLSSGVQQSQAVVLANRSRPQQRLQTAPDPNRRFTFDPTLMEILRAQQRGSARQAAAGPSVPFVQSPAPTPAPQFRFPGQSIRPSPNPSYNFEQVTRALTKPHQTVPRHFHPVISASTLLTAGRAASLDRSASRAGIGLPQGTRQTVALLGSHAKRDQSTPPTISLDSGSNFLALVKPGAPDDVGMQGQVAAFSDQPRHSEVVDRMFHQPLPKMPAMMNSRATDYSSTHRMTTTRNYFKGTEEVTYEQSMQHQPPPVPAYYPPMVAGSSAMPEQFYDVGGQRFTQAEVDAAALAQQQADQQRLLLETAAAIVLQHQQQQDEAAGDRANELLQEESEVYHRRDQERLQREQDEVDRVQVNTDQAEREDQLTDRLRRVSGGSQRSASKQPRKSCNLFDQFTLNASEPTLNQLNSVEHSEAGSIADDTTLPNESSQQSDIGNLDGDNITETLLDETNGRFNQMTRHLVESSDSDSDNSERPADRKVEREAVKKLIFHRDALDSVDKYSDGEQDLTEKGPKKGKLPPGAVKIPVYDHVLPRFISAWMLTEMVQGVTPEDLRMYVKVVRDNIISQLDLMNDAEVPTIDQIRLTEEEKASGDFDALLEDTDSYQLGQPLPSAIVLPPIYRKIDYFRQLEAGGLHEFSEMARDAGAYIYTFPGQAARRNLKAYGKIRKLDMKDYITPNEDGHVLPTFFKLVPSSSGTPEVFLGKDITKKIAKVVDKDPKKKRDLFLALQDVRVKDGEDSEWSYIFKDEQGKPVRIVVPDALADQIWDCYPDLDAFNREYWRYLQANPGLVFASFNLNNSLINPDQQVAYLGQTNKRGYLGLAYGIQTDVCHPKSTVRMFGHPSPFMQQPGRFVRHSVQHSGRTVNISVAAEHVDQVIDIERADFYPDEYVNCPSFHLHAKFYNPMLLAAKSGGKIKVAMSVTNVGDMVTFLDGSMFMQIPLSPIESSNTYFLAAYNKTLALSMTKAKLEAVCMCPGNKQIAKLAAETPARLQATFHFLARDKTIEVSDEPENACWPCGLYPVDETWNQRHGQLQNHMKFSFDPVTGLANRDSCPSPFGLVPQLRRENLTASYHDRHGDVKISSSDKAKVPRPISKGRKSKTAVTTPRISVADQIAQADPLPRHRFRKSGGKQQKPKPLTVLPPKPKRLKVEEPSEEQEDAEEPKEGDTEEEEEDGSEVGSESEEEKSESTVRVQDDESEQVDEKPISDCQEAVEEKVESKEKASKRKRTTKPVRVTKIDEPSSLFVAPSSSMKRQKTTQKKAAEKVSSEETEKDKAPVEPEKEAAKPATRSSVAAAKPATKERPKRTNEVSALLNFGVNYGATKPDIPTKSAIATPAPKPLPTEVYGHGEKDWEQNGDLSAAGPSTRSSATKRTPIPTVGKTPLTIKDAFLELTRNTRAASEAAAKADKAKKKKRGKQYPTKAIIEDDEDSDEDEMANGEGDDEEADDEMD